MNDMSNHGKRKILWVMLAGLMVLALMLPLFVPGIRIIAVERAGPTRESGGDEVNDQIVDRRQHMKRANPRNMTTAEVIKFLRGSVIPKLEMQNMPLPDALEMVNEALHQHATDLKPPKILVDLDYRYRIGNSKPPQVMELRVRNIPAGIALKYICDATKCQLWVDNGNLYVASFDVDRSEKFANRFLDEARIARFEFNGGRFSEALHLLRKQIDTTEQPSDYFGFGAPGLSAADAAGNPDTDPENPLPAWGESIGSIRMQNANLRQILDELCRLTGRRHVIFEGDIQILPPLEKKANEDQTVK